MELTFNLAHVMDDEKKETGILNQEFRLRDIVQFVVAVISATIFIVTMNAKIDALTSAINELKDNNNKMSIANDLAIKSLQNTVSAQGIEISLIQKDVDFLKNTKK
jgi:hypothetical protein